MKSALRVNEHVVVELRPVDDLAAVWAQPVWGAAKAVLLVYDRASREAAERIAAGAASRSIACHLVEDLPAEADDLIACQRLLREACESRLGRRDCLIGLGSYETLARIATVGSWLRRSTKTIPIIRDPEVLAALLERSGRWELRDLPVTATPLHLEGHTHRRSLVVVDTSAVNMSAIRSVRFASSTPRGFDITWTDDVFADATDWFQGSDPGAKAFVLVDDYVGCPRDRILERLEQLRCAGTIGEFWLEVMTVDGAKNLENVGRLLRRLEELGFQNGDCILVFGGGTLMDLGGFVAATYRHPLTYVRAPTTLVGMIDAGVGLKVGVDSTGRKNLVGSYHPAQGVICDPRFLSTLPLPELRCGLSEAIKIAAVCDLSLFELIENTAEALLDGCTSSDVTRMLRWASSAMLEQLEANPYEFELRRLPDFGHEFGHWLEAQARGRLRHGEAVAIGMALSSHLAWSVGRLPRADLDRLIGLLRRIGLPVHDVLCDPATLWRALSDDIAPQKGGQIHLVVPLEIGRGGFLDSLHQLQRSMLEDACAELASRAGDRATGCPPLPFGGRTRGAPVLGHGR